MLIRQGEIYAVVLSERAIARLREQWRECHHGPAETEARILNPGLQMKTADDRRNHD